MSKQNTLKDAYSALLSRDKELLQLEVVRELNISIPTFYRKLDDPVLFSPIEVKAVKLMLLRYMQNSIRELEIHLNELETEVKKPFKKAKT